MAQPNEKGHAFDLATGVCRRCGMTVREYEDRGRPPCPAGKGERPQAPADGAGRR
jgi:hypothetical protein